jgi:phosphoribosylglycinamide formyltransferase-1
MSRIKIAIFVSGTGSNALKIISHVQSNAFIEVGFVLTNNSNSEILVSAQKHDVPTLVHSNAEVESGSFLVDLCTKHQIDYIVLAGFLRKIPAELIAAFPDKIINIHPALLPDFGGAGMYGMHVHRAVVEKQVKQTGITIHFVNEEYDRGRILAQVRCLVLPTDTPETVQARVQRLEHAYFPTVIEQTILNASHV